MPKRHRRWLLTIPLLLLAIPVVIWKTDIALAELEMGPLGGEAEVDAWIERVEAVHGARARWLAQGEVELQTRGHLAFTPLRPMFGTALSDPTVELTLTFRPDTHGVYRYVLQQGQAVRSGVVDNRGGRGALGFMFDSVRHLFEVPWSASGVPYRRGLAQGPDGLDGVFLTWGADHEPTRDHDQVALWSRDGRVVRMDTTGRDVAPFIVARVDFEGEVVHDGLLFPRLATVRDQNGKLVHGWELLNVRRSAADSGVNLN